MDNFLEELTSITKLPFNEIISDYKLIMISNKALYLCNFVKILDYSENKITIRVKKMRLLMILGENLQICQINKGEIVIKGNISSCDFGVSDEKK